MKKLNIAQRGWQSGRTANDAPRPAIQGYVDERSTGHIAGWMRNLNDPAERIAFEVAVMLQGESRVIATGLANLPDPALRKLAIGDGCYGFRVDFAAPLTARDRDHLVVRSAQSDIPLELAPQFQGYLDERSIHHVAGWIRNRSDPEERVAFEVVLPEPGRDRILATGHAA